MLGFKERLTNRKVVKILPFGSGGIQCHASGPSESAGEVDILIAPEILLTAFFPRPPLPWTRLHKVLSLDVKQRGSFLLETCTILVPDPQDGNTPTYWLIRNSLLHDIAKEARRNNWRVRGAKIGTTEGVALHPFQVKKLFGHKSPKRQELLARGLVACITLSILAAPFIYITKLDTLEDEMVTQVNSLSPLAKQAKSKISNLRNAQNAKERIEASFRSSASVTTILDELSTTLPLDSWVSEISLKEDKLTISGYARSAAELIDIFGDSSTFSNAEFISPVEHNAEKNVDRFSLVARVKSHD